MKHCENYFFKTLLNVFMKFDEQLFLLNLATFFIASSLILKHCSIRQCFKIIESCYVSVK